MSLQFSLKLSLFCLLSVQSFDLANHLQTAPELVNRVYNRPTLETLETKSVQGDLKPQSIIVCMCVCGFQYETICKITRCIHRR